MRSRVKLHKGRGAEVQQDKGAEEKNGSQCATRQECKNTAWRKGRSSHKAKVLKSKDPEEHEGRLSEV